MHILTQKLRPGKNDFLKVFQQAKPWRDGSLFYPPHHT